MDRRNFLKTSALVLSSAMLAKYSGTAKLFANTRNVKDFSIELISDNPDLAGSLIEKLINSDFNNYRVVKYSEFSIDGTQNGDIVYFNDGKLVNYKKSNDNVSQKLTEISKTLELPKLIDNPKKIRFYTQHESAKAKNYLVIHDGTIVDSIKASVQNKEIKVKGSDGNLLLSAQDGKMSVKESSCKHKTCVKTGTISKSGEYLVCIPNRIVIMAE